MDISETQARHWGLGDEFSKGFSDLSARLQAWLTEQEQIGPVD